MREVEQSVLVDRGPDGDVARCERVWRLREQEVQEIAQHPGRRSHVVGPPGDGADVGDDHTRHARLARHAHRHVRREPAVDEHVLIVGDGSEHDRDGGAGAHGLREVAAAEHDRRAAPHVRRHGDERRREPGEVAPRRHVRAKQELIEERVDLTLARRGTLQTDSRARLLDDERRSLRHDRGREVATGSERDGRIASKQLLERQVPDERVELPSGHASGIERTDERADARTDDETGANAEAVQNLEHADVCDAMRAAAGQDERDGFRGRGIAEAARRGSTGPRARHRLLRPER